MHEGCCLAGAAQLISAGCSFVLEYGHGGEAAAVPSQKMLASGYIALYAEGGALRQMTIENIASLHMAANVLFVKPHERAGLHLPPRSLSVP